MKKRDNGVQIVCIQYYHSLGGELILASMGNALCLCDWNELPCAEQNKRRIGRYVNADFRIATSPVIEQAKRQLDEPTLRIAVGKDDSHEKLWRFTVKGKKVSK